MYYLRVYDAANGALVGRLADITTAGLMLVGDAPLSPGSRHRLQVEMPPELGGEAEALELDAECVWSRPDVNATLHASGLQFHGVDDDTELRIQRLIRRLGFDD